MKLGIWTDYVNSDWVESVRVNDADSGQLEYLVFFMQDQIYLILMKICIQTLCKVSPGGVSGWWSQCVCNLQAWDTAGVLSLLHASSHHGV